MSSNNAVRGLACNVIGVPSEQNGVAFQNSPNSAVAQTELQELHSLRIQQERELSSQFGRLEPDVTKLAHACEGLLTLVAMYKVELASQDEEIRSLRRQVQVSNQPKFLEQSIYDALGTPRNPEAIEPLVERVDNVVDWSHDAMKYLIGSVEEGKMDVTRRNIEALYDGVVRKRKREEYHLAIEDMDIDVE
ncbi:hypothetical protein CPB84DRAFT_1773715 [Gymnopilus junonius]|uniref:Uncharacterized protein n=1 Tax=Gymnopilus junonius TaxID=109634 RepID=A0A9P5NU86_GYMJU|nr:hypothetical protein CPB84DRAFT_1773715 [Gymnopilus junonius]